MLRARVQPWRRRPRPHPWSVRLAEAWYLQASVHDDASPLPSLPFRFHFTRTALVLIYRKGDLFIDHIVFVCVCVRQVRMMDDDPFIIAQFQVQQLKCTRDKFGNVIDGSPNTIQRVFYFWGLQQVGLWEQVV